MGIGRDGHVILISYLQFSKDQKFIHFKLASLSGPSTRSDHSKMHLEWNESVAMALMLHSPVTMPKQQ